jgi:hypothetical protein
MGWRNRRSEKFPNAFCRWNQADDQILISAWCEFHIENIARRLGRSVYAVRVRADELKLGGARARYTTLKAAALETGYHRDTILHVAEHLGIVLQRMPRTTPGGRRSKIRRFVVEPEQLDQICAFLGQELVGRNRWRPNKTGRWGEAGKPSACLDCGRSDRRHSAKGLCVTCYERRRDRERRVGAQQGEAA